MNIPFECSYEKSEQAMVAGHFLYIICRIDSPTTSNCGAHCWKQAGEEWIMPAESKLAASESGEGCCVRSSSFTKLLHSDFVFGKLNTLICTAEGKGSVCSSSTILSVVRSR